MEVCTAYALNAERPHYAFIDIRSSLKGFAWGITRHNIGAVKVISSSHKHVRSALHSLRDLHMAGYEKIRFMPLVANGEYSIRIGPRRIFARRDGLYIPQDLRHRSLLIKDGEDIADRAAVLSRLRYALFGENHEDKSLDDGLWGRDSEYAKWLKSLLAFLDDFDYALPIRDYGEYASLVPPLLRVEFLEQITDRPIAPTARFELPPEGLLISSGENNCSSSDRPLFSATQDGKKRTSRCPFCQHDISVTGAFVCPNCGTGIPADVQGSSLHWPEHKVLSSETYDGNDGRHIADN